MSYFVTYLIYLATLARAIGWNYESSPLSIEIWILLVIFGLVLFSERALTARFPLYPRFYIFLQAAMIIIMLYRAPTLDFLSLLLLPLCFQTVQFFPNRVGFILIGIYVLAMSGRLFLGLEWQAGLTMVLTGAGMGFLMGSFAYLISRTEKRRQENQRLLIGLQEAYRQLKDYTSQVEALGAATERYRLVRELHDTLTQTLFSMNLSVQAAQLSMGEGSLQAEEHLIRLQNLTRSASNEVQALMGRAPHWSLARGGLEEAIRNLAQERLEQDGLQVTVESTGTRDLPELVGVGLYRIVQEALNNITRHAGVQQAFVRLCLNTPVASVEIIDHGQGFDLASSATGRGFGIAGMTDRAREMGWELDIKSSPGEGTLVCAHEKVP